MFDRYTDHARRTLFFARHEVSESGGSAIETEHLLLGLLRDTGVAARVFAAASVTPEVLGAEIRRRLPAREKPPTSVEIRFSDEAVRILAMAAEESDRLRHDHIGTGHLLLGVLANPSTFAGRVLREHGIHPDAVRDHVVQSTPTSHHAGDSLTADDVAAITHITDRFVELVLARDFAGAANLYTTDATVMPPHHPAVTGRGAIEQWMASLPPVTRFTFEIDAIDGRIDMAYVRGRYSATLQTPDGPVDNRGKFLEIRRRQPDGSWLMESDIFNSDLP